MKVVLISVMNSGVANVDKVEFQVAVPKSMRVKLQPPTGRDLPAFNPLATAPTIIKQVMLIASPPQVRRGVVRAGQGGIEVGLGRGAVTRTRCSCGSAIRTTRTFGAGEYCRKEYSAPLCDS